MIALKTYHRKTKYVLIAFRWSRMLHSTSAYGHVYLFFELSYFLPNEKLSYNPK